MMTRTPKFKKGDRLKIVSDPQEIWAGSDWNLGEYFTVARVDASSDYVVYWDWDIPPTAREWWPDGAKCGVMEEEVELAEVADSPLWKALE